MRRGEMVRELELCFCRVGRSRRCRGRWSLFRHTIFCRDGGCRRGVGSRAVWFGQGRKGGGGGWWLFRSLDSQLDGPL